MIAADLLDKADQALASARLLLESGDLDGACNRAYYAMFDAARAALLLAAPAAPDTIRTHNGLIAAFSLHLVKSGQISVDYGKALNRVAEIRLVADYTNKQVDAATTTWAVDEAGRFVVEMRGRFTP